MFRTVLSSFANMLLSKRVVYLNPLHSCYLVLVSVLFLFLAMQVAGV